MPNCQTSSQARSQSLGFRTSDWGDPTAADYIGPKLDEGVTEQPYEYCRFKAYRDHPDIDPNYDTNKVWMHVFVGRLGFILVFEVCSQHKIVVESD